MMSGEALSANLLKALTRKLKECFEPWVSQGFVFFWELSNAHRYALWGPAVLIDRLIN